MPLNLTTFSITARDARDATLGVAVSTKVPAVGSLCPFVRFGAGAVSTQAWVNPGLGPLILDRLQQGERADAALDHVMSAETDADLRQLGVVDANGGSAAHTGRGTDAWAGHRIGLNYSVQGNMLVGEDTIAAMENFSPPQRKRSPSAYCRRCKRVKQPAATAAVANPRR